MKIIYPSDPFATEKKRRPGRPSKLSNDAMVETMEAEYAMTGKYRHLTKEFIANGWLPNDIRAARKEIERLWARSRKTKAPNTRISK